MSTDFGKIRNLLEQEAAENEAIFQSIGYGLIVSDHENTITMINEAAARLLRVEATQVSGKEVNQVLKLERLQVESDSGGEAETESILAVASSGFGAFSNGDYFVVRKDGTKFPAQINAFSIIMDNMVAGVVIVFHDKTEDLEAQRAQSDFIAISSHQLRTPLGSMKWNLEMLLDGELGSVSAEVQKVSSELLESVERMIALVNDLLSASRITQRRLTDRLEETDVLAVVDRVAAEWVILAKQKGVNLVVEKPSQPVARLLVNSLRLMEVIANLVSNGVKYNRPGGKVVVRVEQVGSVIRVSVKDTGMGVGLSDQKRLFSRFFRADNAIKQDPDGTGLGLFVVKSFVEAWGGKVGFESEVNRGSTFWIEIPTKQ